MSKTYTYGYMDKDVTVPATIVGDLAIFRLGTYWHVHHVPTRAHVHKAMPARFMGRNGMVGASKRELVAWAKAWQEACPAFFLATGQLRPAGDVHYAAGRS